MFPGSSVKRIYIALELIDPSSRLLSVFESVRNFSMNPPFTSLRTQVILVLK